MKDPQIRDMFARIDAWLRATGTSESRLGLLAAGNQHAVARIRNGGATVRTLEAVLEYLTDHPAPSAARAVTPKKAVKQRKSEEKVSDDAYRSRLLAARHATGMTQEQFAAQISVRYHTYKQWEIGRFRTPAVAALAAELYCDLEGIQIASTAEKKRT